MTSPKKPKRAPNRRKPAPARPRASSPVPTPSSTEASGDIFDSESMLRAAAWSMQLDLLALERVTATEADEVEALVKNKSRLGAVISQIHAQLRQREKATERAAKTIPLEMIVAHLKTLDAEKRKHICAEIMGVDDEGPVL